MENAEQLSLKWHYDASIYLPLITLHHMVDSNFLVPDGTGDIRVLGCSSICYFNFTELTRCKELINKAYCYILIVLAVHYITIFFSFGSIRLS